MSKWTDKIEFEMNSLQRDMLDVITYEQASGKYASKLFCESAITKLREQIQMLYNHLGVEEAGQPPQILIKKEVCKCQKK